jgi:hypothetical protein
VEIERERREKARKEIFRTQARKAAMVRGVFVPHRRHPDYEEIDSNADGDADA